MVVFTCSHCGDSIKKVAVSKHYQTRCRYKVPFVTCVDCLKDFKEDEYEAHTKCVTEKERYSAKGFVPKTPSCKGEAKQKAWNECFNSLLSSGDLKPDEKKFLLALSGCENIPRKKYKFMNFVKSSYKYYANKNDLLERTWAKMESHSQSLKGSEEKPKDEEENQEKTGDEKKGKSKKKTDEDAVAEADEPEKTTESSETEKKKKKKNKRKNEEDEENVGAPDETEEASEHKVKKKKKKKQEQEEGEEKEEERSKTNDAKAAEEDDGNDKPKKKKSKHSAEAATNDAQSHIQNGNADKNDDDGDSKNKQKTKKKLEVANGDDEPKSKKSKSSSGKAETEADDKENVNGKEVVAGDDSGTQSFDWGKEILDVLTGSGSQKLPLKKLQKKVLKKYCQTFNCEATDKTTKKFVKKLNKMADRVIVDGEFASLAA